jgi:hypothetical protein
MATPFQTSLFGIDPLKYRQERASEYDRLMAAQQSPQSRIGFALGNLLGGVFGGEDPILKRASDIQGIYNKVAQQFPDQTSPEFYKALADAIPPQYADAKIIASERAQQAEDAAFKRIAERTKADQEIVKFYTENPDQASTELQRLAKIIEANPNDTAALARYEKIATAGTTGAITRAGKEEKADVELKKDKALIAKYERERVENAKLNPIDKYNNDIQAARDLLKVYGVDPTKPIKDQVPSSVMISAGSVLLKAQENALLQKTTEGGTPLSSAAAAPVAGDPAVKAAVEKAGGVYDPANFDYRIVNGQVQRKPKGK